MEMVTRDCITDGIADLEAVLLGPLVEEISGVRGNPPGVVSAADQELSGF